MSILLILALILSILPFPILTVLYGLIPDKVPLFVDLMGNPTVMTAKTILSVYRLPVMGLMIQVVCILMALVKFGDGDILKKNKKVWSAVSFMGAVKMSATSMEIIFYENSDLLQAFRLVVMASIIAAVVMLLLNLNSLYRKNQTKELVKSYTSMNRCRIAIISSAMFVYVLMVFLPTILK